MQKKEYYAPPHFANNLHKPPVKQKRVVVDVVSPHQIMDENGQPIVQVPMMNVYGYGPFWLGFAFFMLTAMAEGITGVIFGQEHMLAIGFAVLLVVNAIWIRVVWYVALYRAMTTAWSIGLTVWVVISSIAGIGLGTVAVLSPPPQIKFDPGLWADLTRAILGLQVVGSLFGIGAGVLTFFTKEDKLDECRVDGGGCCCC